MPFRVTSGFGLPRALTVIVPTADEALRRAELLIESGATEVRIGDDAGRVYGHAGFGYGVRHAGYG